MNDHTPLRATERQYRGFTLRTERMGHTNVISEAGRFCGGFKSFAAARDWTDHIIRRANTQCIPVRLPDGRTAYRVIFPQD